MSLILFLPFYVSHSFSPILSLGLTVRHGSTQSVAEFYGQYYSNSDLATFLAMTGMFLYISSICEIALLLYFLYLMLSNNVSFFSSFFLSFFLPFFPLFCSINLFNSFALSLSFSLTISLFLFHPFSFCLCLSLSFSPLTL